MSADGEKFMKNYPPCKEFLSISVTRHSLHHGYHQENTGTLATAVCPMVGRKVLTEITSPTSLSKSSFLLCPRDREAKGSSFTGVTALWSWARYIYPSLVLVQPRKTRPCLTERLLMGRKESNQTNKQKFLLYTSICLSVHLSVLSHSYPGISWNFYCKLM